MGTAFSIVIGILTAAAATYLAYLGQSRRDSRILWKNRNSFLYKIMKECYNVATLESTHLTSWTVSINSTPFTYPLLQQTSGTKTLFDILAEKVMLDEYYFAYNRLFFNYIKAEELYYNLQKSALHLKATYEQSLTMIEEGQQKDHQRQLLLLDIYNQSTEWINSRIQTCGANELKHFLMFREIHLHFLEIKMEGQPADFNVMHDEYFALIGHFIKMNPIPDSLVPFGMIVNKFFSIYHSIGFQNKDLAENVNDSIQEFKDAIGTLKDVIKYWNENLRKYL